MRTSARILLFLVAAMYVAAVMVPAALAQTIAPAGTKVDRDTVCGAAATGRSRVTREVVQMQMKGNRVDADGYWVPCDRACPGSQRFAEWAANGYACTSAERLETSPTSRQRLQGSMHGDSETIRQRQGAMRGSVTYTCTDGVYTRTAATCEPAPTISGCSTAIDVTAGRCRFRHAGQGADGDVVAIRPRPGQGDMRARCWAGLWVAESIYCAR